MSSAGKHCAHVFTRGQPRRPSRSAAPGAGGGGSSVSGLLGPTVASSAGLASASAAVGSASAGAASGSTSAAASGGSGQQALLQSSAVSARGCKTFLLAFDTENELALAYCALLKVFRCLAFFLLIVYSCPVSCFHDYTSNIILFSIGILSFISGGKDKHDDRSSRREGWLCVAERPGGLV